MYIYILKIKKAGEKETLEVYRNRTVALNEFYKHYCISELYCSDYNKILSNLKIDGSYLTRNLMFDRLEIIEKELIK